MIDAKTRKRRLFRRSRPLVRPFALMDGEAYSKDTGVLWAAYQAGSFKAPPGMTQAQFVEFVQGLQEGADNLWLVDDDNKGFKSGRGPVALVSSRAVDLIQEPVFVFFKWASCRNVLRVTVAYLTMAKSSTQTGVLLVRASGGQRSVVEHMKHYGLLFFMGKSRVDEYLYSIRGLGSAEK